MGSQSYGIDTDMVARVAGEIADVVAQDIEVCLVIGGGNIFRGVYSCRYGTRHRRLYGYASNSDERTGHAKCIREN